MNGRSFHDVIRNATDRTYLKEMGSWLILGCAGLLISVWGPSRVPWRIPSQAVYWFGVAAAIYGGGALAFHAFGYCSYLRTLSLRSRDAAREKVRRAKDARRPLREAVRAFGEMLETNYSWVLSMDPLEAQKRALLWHEKIVRQWTNENERWFELRKSDQWQEVISELGEPGSRMLAIWQRRRVLFQYAVAYSTEATRAKEILAIEREIRQLQVHEAREQQRFQKQIEADRDMQEGGRYLNE